MTQSLRLKVSIPLLVGLAFISLRMFREPMLRWAGRVVVTNEVIEPADMIVITVDADGGGVLEAADLVRSGMAPRVAVFADPPDVVDREFIRRGVAYEDLAAREIRQLQSLGVARVEQIPRSVAGSEDEGDTLPGWCDQHELHSVVVVTSADHSRRLRRILHRAMTNHRTRVTVRPATFSNFNPDTWWQTRGGVRTEIIEVEKLLLDFVRHPFS